jgi:hypothetical protein
MRLIRYRTSEIGITAKRKTQRSIPSDGKIVAVGDAYTGTGNDFVLARYNTDGSPDTSFGSGGKVTTRF